MHFGHLGAQQVGGVKVRRVVTFVLITFRSRKSRLDKISKGLVHSVSSQQKKCLLQSSCQDCGGGC